MFTSLYCYQKTSLGWEGGGVIQKELHVLKTSINTTFFKEIRFAHYLL